MSDSKRLTYCFSLIATAGITHTTSATPRRYLAYLAAFSKKHTLKQVYDFLSTRLRINKEDIRIWKFKDEVRILYKDGVQNGGALLVDATHDSKQCYIGILCSLDKPLKFTYI